LTGGGIFIDGGTLTLTSCTVSNNQADFGAGISALDGDVTITSATISGNSAPDAASDGGGIYFTGTKARKLTIETSTIDANSAGFGAGVILVDSEGTSLKLRGVISDSTISNNTCVVCTTSSTAHTQGAGAEVESAKLTVTNSTISGNSASGTTGFGGGILSSSGKVTLNNTTIANNTASSGGGIFVDLNNKKFVASNSIIGTNNAFAGADCTGALTSHDYNFIGDSSNCTVSDKTVHDLSGNPMLGPLQNNGGTTDTQALLTGSPALGAANPGSLSGGSHCETTDQIGTARTKGDCDIGAYQLPD
jgi:fibronectin-binding autotransporter adhesin